MSAQPGPPTETAPPLFAYLRRRLLPRGAELLVWVSYTIVFVVLIALVLGRPAALTDQRFYGAIVAVLGVLLLYIFAPDVRTLAGDNELGEWIVLLASAGLVMLATWFSGSMVLIYLLYMLLARAMLALPQRPGLAYAAGVYGGWLGLISQIIPFQPGGFRDLALSASIGIVFVLLLAILLRDNTEQTERASHLASELQAANAALLAARQREKELAAAEERVHLAREIHDGLGHHLTALNVQLQAAAKLLDREPERVGDILDTCRAEAQAALEETRRSVAVLRRTPLDGRSLGEALTALTADFDRASPLAVSLSITGEAYPLRHTAAMTCYRAAQEGLTNAQKHARSASRVDVALAFAPEAVTLTVSDDGQPAADEPSTGASGFGLAGLRERAEQLGGTFDAQRGPEGFRLALSLPAEEVTRD